MFKYRIACDILDIDKALECLSKISVSNLHLTDHFKLRSNQRKNDLIQDVENIPSIILKNKPVSISKQNDTTFKLLYELDNDYDLTIVISIRIDNPVLFNLITCFKVTSHKRKREE